MTDRLALPHRYRDQLEALLSKHVPGVEVWAYGSRVNGESHEGSDLDIVLRSPTLKPLDGGLYDLLEAIEKSNIPILVQTHDWAMLPESFHREIERDYVLVQEPTKEKGRPGAGWRESVYGLFQAGLQESPLGSLCSYDDGIQTGPFGSQLHKRDYVVTGTPIITVEHLGENRITHRDMPCVSDHDRDRLSKYALRKGDIVFSRVGSVDRRALVRHTEDGWLFSGRCLRIRPNVNKIDPTYLSYFFGLPTFQEHIRSIAVGATMPSLNTKILSDVSILYPPLPEQRAITRVLGALDDKIELSRRMNETLEEMARALFKSWFVDFGPVRAKMEGRWRRGESLPGVPADLYGLFPDRLVDSELGEIPEGWGVRQLGNCFNLTMGQSPPGSTYNDNRDGLPFFQGNADFGTRFPKNRKYCNAPTRVARAEDTLVSVRAPVGAINMAWEQCCIGRGVAALRHDSGSTSFTYYLVWALQEEIQQYEHTGTVFGAITKGQFEDLRVIEPDAGIINAFDSCARPLDERIKSNIAETRSLSSQRDALLPKLVSGEVGVGEASAFTMEVTN